MKEVICDKCEKEFKIDLRVESISYKGTKMEKHYFSCSECSKEYIVHYSTPAIKEKIEKQKRLKKKLQALDKQLLDEQTKIEQYFNKLEK